MRAELQSKVTAHEKLSQQKTRELASLRKAAEAAQRRIHVLEEESRKQKAMLKV